MSEKFYGAIAPFVGEVYVFPTENALDRWLAFDDEESVLMAEIGEPNTERRTAITESDVKRLFLDCEPDTIKCENQLFTYALFHPMVQHAALQTIKARERYGLDNVAPLIPTELTRVKTLIEFQNSIKN